MGKIISEDLKKIIVISFIIFIAQSIIFLILFSNLWCSSYQKFCSFGYAATLDAFAVSAFFTGITFLIMLFSRYKKGAEKKQAASERL